LLKGIVVDKQWNTGLRPYVQSGIGPIEGDESTGAPAEPEATGRPSSTEPEFGVETTGVETTEESPEADSLSAAGDQTADTTDQEKAKYIEKRGLAIFAAIRIYK